MVFCPLHGSGKHVFGFDSADHLTASSRISFHTSEWAGRLMSSGLCVKFMLDTYEQEVERFGGHLGMATAEAIFFADSSSAAALVRCLKRKLWPHDQATLVILSVDNLLSSLGFDESEGLNWYETQTKSTKIDISAEYRQREPVLRLLVGQSEEVLANEPDGPEIALILAKRGNAISVAAEDLRKFTGQGVLSQSLDTLASSFVPLHLNRMAGLDGASDNEFSTCSYGLARV